MDGKRIMRFKLPYGLKNGELIHISTIEKGLNYFRDSMIEKAIDDNLRGFIQNKWWQI